MNRSLLGSLSCARILSPILLAASLFAGCGSEAPKPEAQKPAEPVVPEEIQDAAKAFLGSETTVLLFGDLALNGKQEFLAANVVPNTPKKMVAGTAVTRAIVAEKDDSGKWVELMRADEHLKNPNGYLGLTPLQPVSGWKLQYENSPEKGMALYFTPITSGSTRTIEVKYNPATKRYQSLDINYEHFLLEAPSLENPRSMLR